MPQISYEGFDFNLVKSGGWVRFFLSGCVVDCTGGTRTPANDRVHKPFPDVGAELVRKPFSDIGEGKTRCRLWWEAATANELLRLPLLAGPRW